MLKAPAKKLDISQDLFYLCFLTRAKPENIQEVLWI